MSRVYLLEFRAEVVRLYRAGGVSIDRLAEELGVSHATLSRWVKQDREAQTSLNVSERERLRQAEKGLVRLREENLILKKAAAFFAKESTINR